MKGCHSCKKARTLANCANCRVVDLDAKRIKYEPNYLRHGEPATERRESDNPVPPAEMEALHDLLYAVTSLDPISALLVLYVSKNGTLVGFGRFLSLVANDINGYGRTMSRQTTNARWKAVCNLDAPFSVLRSR